MPSPDTHHRLGPSSSSRWLACPWSLRSPYIPAGKAAEEGTDAHNWGANVLEGGITLTDVPIRFQYGLSMYTEYVYRWSETPIVERLWQSMEIPASATERLPPIEGLEEGFGGTLDCLSIQSKSAFICDLKWGEHKVKAPGNTQLLSYASLVHEHFAVSTFHAAIVQPNSKGGPNISTTTFTEQEVIDHRERVKLAAASDEKRTGFQCLFCPLRITKQCQEGVEHARKKGWKYKV